MNILLAWRKQLQAQIASKTFIARELALGYVRSGPAMKILISERDGWTHTINRKFRFTQHHATFGDISEATRSEEHTSELQSLMRISYAVFCLKKKKKHKQTNKTKYNK